MGLVRIRRRETSLDASSGWMEVPDISDTRIETSNMFDVKQKKRKDDCKIRLDDIAVILIVLTVAISLLLVKSLDSLLPEPILRKDLDNQTIQFCAERARDDVEALTAIGPRVTGSNAADNITVKMLLSFLNEINSANGFNPELALDIEVQKPSGSFQLGSGTKVGGETAVYMGISNVVAKLGPKIATSNDSVLINCHFDTKPGAPGATDNMISCASMLEILRVMSQAPALRNSIVFLFNGAEELGLHGAHGFVKGDGGKGHRWAKDLRCFINLEGAGSGGKAILFQTGPGNSWVMDAYEEAAPHPYGLVLGEEAFQRGLIPSDTDFRIFRDYINIPGLDIAFIKNGWLYHTKKDIISEVPSGSIQHMGANALALILQLGNQDFSQVTIEKGGSQRVFFDVLGLFMVNYSETVGIILSFLFAVVFILLVAVEVRLNKLSRFVVLVKLFATGAVAWGLGIAVSAFVGGFFKWTGYCKPFYSYPFLALVLFGLPVLFTQALVYSIFWKGSQRKSWLAGKFTMAIVLMIGAYITRAVYILCLHIFFAILAWFPRPLYKRLKMPEVTAVSDILIGDLIPFIFSSYLAIFLSDSFVPIMGRSGWRTDSNVYLSVILGAVLSCIVFNGISAYLAKQRKILLFFALVFSIFLLNPMIVVGFIGKIPYQEKTPLRIQLHDTDRTWYNEDMTVNRTDAGYWFSVVDGDTINFMPELATIIPELQGYEEISAGAYSCPDLLCNQPFLWQAGDLKKTPWVPKADGLPDSVKDQVGLEILRNEDAADGKRKLELIFKGPSQLSIAVSPGSNWTLGNWSLEVDPFSESYIQGERLVYFIFVNKGLNSTDFKLEVELKNKQENGTALENERVLEVLYVAHFLQGDNERTDAFEAVVNKFSAWTNVMAWTSVLKQYLITPQSS